MAKRIQGLYGPARAERLKNDVASAWAKRRFDVPPDEDARHGTRSLYELLRALKAH